MAWWRSGTLINLALKLQILIRHITHPRSSSFFFSTQLLRSRNAVGARRWRVRGFLNQTIKRLILSVKHLAGTFSHFVFFLQVRLYLALFLGLVLGEKKRILRLRSLMMTPQHVPCENNPTVKPKGTACFWSAGCVCQDRATIESIWCFEVLRANRDK